MTNHFKTLDLPQAAALADETLQSAYLQKSKTAHPDQAGGDTQIAAAINEAREILAHPEKRLKHLLELKGHTEWKAVPMDETYMSVFSKLSTTLPRTRTFTEKASRSQCALTKALRASEEMLLRETLEEIGSEIASLRTALLQSLQGFDARISQGDENVWADLYATQARLSYTAKWQAQVREALLHLQTMLLQ